MNTDTKPPASPDQSDDDLVQFTPASRSLQKKAGGPKGKFNRFKLEAAQGKINERADQFMKEVGAEINALRSAHAQIAEKPDAADPEAAAQIALHAREVKGLAGTFGFDLLTQIGDSLYEFASDISKLDSKRIGLMGAHIDAMELVVQNKITGDGGDTARELLNTLGIATDKLS